MRFDNGLRGGALELKNDVKDEINKMFSDKL